MTERPPNRVVYSSGPGRVCAQCGWPESSCRCSSRTGAAEEAVPERITARLRIEKKGRAGKTVTVVDGLPRNAGFLQELARELKRACGVGGTVGDGAIELQGDVRDRVRDPLTRRGFTVR